MRARSLVLALAASLALSGCYTTKFYFADNPGVSGDSTKVIQHTFLWGLISPGRVNVDAQCGAKGPKKIKSQVGGWGLLANWITAGIWIPVTVKITCAD